MYMQSHQNALSAAESSPPLSISETSRQSFGENCAEGVLGKGKLNGEARALPVVRADRRNGWSGATAMPARAKRRRVGGTSDQL